jgi:hypothetical protein
MDIYYVTIASIIVLVIGYIFVTISRDLNTLYKELESTRKELDKINIAIGELQRSTQRVLFPDRYK